MDSQSRYDLTWEEKIELGFLFKINKVLNNIVIGFILLMIAVILVIVTFFFSDIDIFVVWVGGFIVGFVQIFTNSFRFFLIKRKYKKYCKQKDSGLIKNYNEFKLKGVKYEYVYIENKDKLIKIGKILKISSIFIVIFVVCSTTYIVADLASYEMEKNRFHGSWKIDSVAPGNYSHIFEDSKFINFTKEYFHLDHGTLGEYRISNGRIILDYMIFDLRFAFDYSFENNDKTLILVTLDSKEIILTKQN